MGQVNCPFGGVAIENWRHHHIVAKHVLEFGVLEAVAFLGCLNEAIITQNQTKLKVTNLCRPQHGSLYGSAIVSVLFHQLSQIWHQELMHFDKARIKSH